MNHQPLSRMEGERRARLTLLRLLCAVSIWRTGMTRILPLCGTSAWWTGLICLVPGFGVALLLRLTMHITYTATLAEAVRVCLGRAGTILLSLMLAALLMLDGVASITAVITVFTQGVGARGTQLTLAVLTGGVLAFSLHREGLARGAHLLRWGMAGAAVILGGSLLSEGRIDHLFPLWGDGEAGVMAALRSGISLAWPVTLMLSLPPGGQGQLRGGVCPAFAAVGAMLLTALAIPHELLAAQGLAGWMLLPARYAPNGLRVLALSLMLLAFFLSIGASVQLAAEQLARPWAKPPAWLAYGLLAAAFLTQAADIPALWAVLGKAEPWLLAPLAGLACVMLAVALIRRKRQ